MIEYIRSDYSLRQLLPADWRSLKSIRLEALATDPSVYGSNLMRESGFPDEEWQQRLAQSISAYWGLFQGMELIGVTGIFCGPEHPEEGKLVASFIRPDHRAHGLSALFYTARLDWARDKGLTRLVVSHRGGNKPSQAAILRAGFQYMHSEIQHWPDGRQAEHLFYMLEL